MEHSIRLGESNDGEATLKIYNSEGRLVGTIEVSEWYTRSGECGLAVDVEAPADGGFRKSYEYESYGPDVMIRGSRLDADQEHTNESAQRS